MYFLSSHLFVPPDDLGLTPMAMTMAVVVVVVMLMVGLILMLTSVVVVAVVVAVAVVKEIVVVVRLAITPTLSHRNVLPLLPYDVGWHRNVS